MLVNTIHVGAMDVNCHVFIDEETNEVMLVDPGDDGVRIEQFITGKGWKPSLIALTHGHFDHIGAVQQLREAYGIPVVIHKEDAAMLTDARKNLSGMTGQQIVLKPADRLLEDSDILTVGKSEIHVLHTPGHSPGSVCYRWQGLVACGDTVFFGSVGRTDFPGGSMDMLLRAVHEKLLVLPDDTVLLPGHGPNTSVGYERLNNPFITRR